MNKVQINRFIPRTINLSQSGIAGLVNGPPARASAFYRSLNSNHFFIKQLLSFIWFDAF